MSTDVASPQQQRNERLMLREYAAAGIVPVHSNGILFSLSLVRKLERDKEQMASAMKWVAEHDDEGQQT